MDSQTLLAERGPINFSGGGDAAGGLTGARISPEADVVAFLIYAQPGTAGDTLEFAFEQYNDVAAAGDPKPVQIDNLWIQQGDTADLSSSAGDGVFVRHELDDFADSIEAYALAQGDHKAALDAANAALFIVHVRTRRMDGKTFQWIAPVITAGAARQVTVFSVVDGSAYQGHDPNNSVVVP